MLNPDCAKWRGEEVLGRLFCKVRMCVLKASQEVMRECGVYCPLLICQHTKITQPTLSVLGLHSTGIFPSFHGWFVVHICAWAGDVYVYSKVILLGDHAAQLKWMIHRFVYQLYLLHCPPACSVWALDLMSLGIAIAHM